MTVQPNTRAQLPSKLQKYILALSKGGINLTYSTKMELGKDEHFDQVHSIECVKYPEFDFSSFDYEALEQHIELITYQKTIIVKLLDEEVMLPLPLNQRAFNEEQLKISYDLEFVKSDVELRVGMDTPNHCYLELYTVPDKIRSPTTKQTISLFRKLEALFPNSTRFIADGVSPEEIYKAVEELNQEAAEVAFNPTLPVLKESYREWDEKTPEELLPKKGISR